MAKRTTVAASARKRTKGPGIPVGADKGPAPSAAPPPQASSVTSGRGTRTSNDLVRRQGAARAIPLAAAAEEVGGEFPKQLYHKDGKRQRRVIDADDQAAWAKKGYGEDPVEVDA